MAAYFAILFYIGRRHEKGAGARGQASEDHKVQAEAAPSIEGFAICQAVGAGICLLAYQMARYVKFFDAGVPLATALSMVAAFTLPQKLRESWSSSSRVSMAAICETQDHKASSSWALCFFKCSSQLLERRLTYERSSPSEPLLHCCSSWLSFSLCMVLSWRSWESGAMRSCMCEEYDLLETEF
eukprot:768478-Hanusia_phi.AAC.14